MLTKMRFQVAPVVAGLARAGTTTELASLATLHATVQVWHGVIAKRKSKPYECSSKKGRSSKTKGAGRSSKTKAAAAARKRK